MEVEIQAIIILMILYYNLKSTGDALNFGDLTSEDGHYAGVGSSSIRGYCHRRYETNVIVIDYVTIASTGERKRFW